MRKTIDFLLNDWLGVASLAERARYSEHSRETFESVLDTCQRIAEEKFAPFNRLVDVQEPRLEDGVVILPQCAYDAARAYVDSGMLAATQDYDVGGMQLPYVLELAANAFFAKAGIGLGGGGMLTVGNANLLMAHGTPLQKTAFAQKEIDGKWFGTMCLSEPQAGSSLSDILTRATPDGDDFAQDDLGPRYRLTGNKMWISNGEHDMSENIVHLVLAKIPAADGKLVPGVRGISLFIVPKLLVNAVGELTGERNDVALAGLNHKMGFRGLPNTLLNFGEGTFPVRGRPARIGVGLGAVGIGYAGYEASLDYARNRKQGRPSTPAGKDPASPPVSIIEHADVKRMLLAQKSYVEGGLALELYCGRLVDEARTGSAERVPAVKALLEILTPIAKSWPSEWCLEANNLAIQVHGGYGYTRDFPVEQYWRDNRLNMIHEGTHGIQGLDLLGRKVMMDDGRALDLLAQRIGQTVSQAGGHAELKTESAAVAHGLQTLLDATRAAWSTRQPDEALANATPYLQAFGHVVVAWLWLDVARVAVAAAAGKEDAFLRGKLQAARFFFDFELPKIDAWLSVVAARNPTCREMQDAWFDG
jgi:alkylation response protein AidB-like acyl-CoA dehydrogenase